MASMVSTSSWSDMVGVACSSGASAVVCCWFCALSSDIRTNHGVVVQLGICTGCMILKVRVVMLVVVGWCLEDLEDNSWSLWMG